MADAELVIVNVSVGSAIQFPAGTPCWNTCRLLGVAVGQVGVTVGQVGVTVGQVGVTVGCCRSDGSDCRSV
jgi:hypothetical protein